MSEPDDVRQRVLDGIDREIALLTEPKRNGPPLPEVRINPAARVAERALRLLRADTERHRPCCGDPDHHDCYSEHVGNVFCSHCSEEWPCPAIRERAEVYAREEGK